MAHAPPQSDPPDPGPSSGPGPTPNPNLDPYRIPNAPRTSSEAWNVPREQLLLVSTYTNPEPPRLGPDGKPAIPDTSEPRYSGRYKIKQSTGLVKRPLLQALMCWRLYPRLP